MMMRNHLLCLVGLALVAGCRHGITIAPPPAPTPYRWTFPQEIFSLPVVPEENPMTEEKVVLGRHLFYEKRLSHNQTYACATCHPQSRAFADVQALPVGSTGDELPRNAMSVVNLAFGSVYTWGNPLMTSLERFIPVPMFADHPAELDMSRDTDGILARLAADRTYQQLFGAAFPGAPNAINSANVLYALASFLRSIVSASSAYDQYLTGHPEAMSPAAQRGLQHFSDFGCDHCHTPPAFTDTYFASNSPDTGKPPPMHNTGLFNIDGKGAYPRGNSGAYEVTRDAADMGKFKAPSLRNIALTGPYFHDGSVATLEGVLDIYKRGGRLLTEGPNAGDGALSPIKDPLIRGIPQLDDTKKAELIEFLNSLTDYELIYNPAYSNPICPTDLPRACDSAPASWANDVGPLVNAACTMCHAEGGPAANRPLVTYENVLALREAILGVLAGCNMPPPSAQPGLADGERALLMNWLLCGAPNH